MHTQVTDAIVARLETIWSQFAAKAEEAFFAQDEFAQEFWDGRARGIRIAIDAVKEETEAACGAANSK